MRVLVTGGAGYIGSAFLGRLVEEGYAVTALDDFSLSRPRNLADAPPFEFARGDVRDRTVVEEAMVGADAVVHLAAITGSSDSEEMRDQVFDVNLGGTETVVDAAETAGVEKIVLASSCNVYGGTDGEVLRETDDPSPPNPYAESKLAAESACFDSDVDAVALRLGTNFGWSPGVRFNLVVNSFVFRALAGEPLTVFGDGTNWRPYLHVRDSARAFAEALEWDPGVYNVGVGNYRISEVADAVVEASDRPTEVLCTRDRDQGTSYHVDFSAARAQGFRPKYGLEDGIEELVDRLSSPQRVVGRV